MIVRLFALQQLPMRVLREEDNMDSDEPAFSFSNIVSRRPDIRGGGRLSFLAFILVPPQIPVPGEARWVTSHHCRNTSIVMQPRRYQPIGRDSIEDV